MKQPGAGPGCCDRRRLVAGCHPGSRYPPHLAFTLVNSSIFLVELLLKAKLCHNMNIAFMLPLIQSVPVLSQQPVNWSKTLHPLTLFTPFAPTYCRWDSTLLPNRFMGRPVIRTRPWKIGPKSVRSNSGLWHQELLSSQVVVHPCPPDKQWKASLQILHTFTLIVDQLNELQRKGGSEYVWQRGVGSQKCLVMGNFQSVPRYRKRANQKPPITRHF